MEPTDSMAKKGDAGNVHDKAWLIAAYIVPYMISGIVVLFLKGGSDSKAKLHSFQSIFLGIAMIVIAIVFDMLSFTGIFLMGTIGALLVVFLWLYGIYVGLEAYSGRDVVMPVITDYARRYSK